MKSNKFIGKIKGGKDKVRYMLKIEHRLFRMEEARTNSKIKKSGEMQTACAQVPCACSNTCIRAAHALDSNT